MTKNKLKYRKDLKIEISLNDRKGNRVSLGDKIAIHFPHKEIEYGYERDVNVFLEKIVYGRLHFRLSCGIGFIFDDVEYLEDVDSDHIKAIKQERMRGKKLKSLFDDSDIFLDVENRPEDGFYHEKGKFYPLRVNGFNWYKVDEN